MLTLLAVPLAYVNPRIGTSFNLIAAAFLYMLYSNCLNIVQSFIAQGKLGFLPGLAHSACDRHRPRALALPAPAVAVRALQPLATGQGGRRMKTLTRYIGREVLTVDPADLQRARGAVRVLRPDPRARRRRARRLHDHRRRCCSSALQLPSRMYELFPVATLIGTLFALAQLVSSSEYTVMRVSGASLLQVGWALMRIGIPLSIVTFLAGEFVAPQAALLSQQVRAQAMGDTTARRRPAVPIGILVQAGPDVRQHPAACSTDLTLVGRQHLRVRPRFPAAQTVRTAESGTFTGNGHWRLKSVRSTDIALTGATRDGHRHLPVGHGTAPVAADGLPGAPGEARAQYAVGKHARSSAANTQKTTRFEIAFWNKVFYPAAVLVMMIVALPFSYFQRRQGGVGFRIFAGTMLGLTFFLIGRLFSNLGVLNDWPPLFSAAFPLAVFVALTAVDALVARAALDTANEPRPTSLDDTRNPRRAKKSRRPAGIFGLVQLRCAASALRGWPIDLAHSATGTIELPLVPCPWSRTWTLPSTSANSVWSLPIPTLTPGWNLCAALADDDAAGVDELAAVRLDAEALRFRVAAVARAAACLLVCHGGCAPSADDAVDLEFGVVLAMALVLLVVLAAAHLEDRRPCRRGHGATTVALTVAPATTGWPSRTLSPSPTIST
mgnify:CR=1 FL=1